MFRTTRVRALRARVPTQVAEMELSGIRVGADRVSVEAAEVAAHVPSTTLVRARSLSVAVALALLVARTTRLGACNFRVAADVPELVPDGTSARA